jgi:hypothetical protein
MRYGKMDLNVDYGWTDAQLNRWSDKLLLSWWSDLKLRLALFILILDFDWRSALVWTEALSLTFSFKFDAQL